MIDQDFPYMGKHHRLETKSINGLVLACKLYYTHTHKVIKDSQRLRVEVLPVNDRLGGGHKQLQCIWALQLSMGVGIRMCAAC